MRADNIPQKAPEPKTGEQSPNSPGAYSNSGDMCTYDSLYMDSHCIAVDRKKGQENNKTFFTNNAPTEPLFHVLKSLIRFDIELNIFTPYMS